jgi:hypothetical protein
MSEWTTADRGKSSRKGFNMTDIFAEETSYERLS